MESLQALAIAAAAFVTGLSLDHVSLTDRLAAEAETIAQRAFVERDAGVRMDNAAFDLDQDGVMRCAAAPKTGWL